MKWIFNGLLRLKSNLRQRKYIKSFLIYIIHLDWLIALFLSQALRGSGRQRDAAEISVQERRRNSSRRRIITRHSKHLNTLLVRIPDSGTNNLEINLKTKRTILDDRPRLSAAPKQKSEQNKRNNYKCFNTCKFTRLSVSLIETNLKPYGKRALQIPD